MLCLSPCIRWSETQHSMLQVVPDTAETAASEAAPAAAAALLDGVPAGLSGPRSIRCADDYGIALPDWLRRCIEHVPPGAGDSCPTDTEGLLASAFHFAYQLHNGQVRASGVLTSAAAR